MTQVNVLAFYQFALLGENNSSVVYGVLQNKDYHFIPGVEAKL